MHAGQLSVDSKIVRLKPILGKRKDRVVTDFILWGDKNREQIGYSCFVEGKGYTTQTLKQILPQIPRHYRRLFIYRGNIASQRVAIKAGFVLSHVEGKSILVYIHPTFRSKTLCAIL